MKKPIKFPITIANLPKGLQRHQTLIKSVLDQRDENKGLIVETQKGTYKGESINAVAYLMDRGSPNWKTRNEIKREAILHRENHDDDDDDDGEWCSYCQEYENNGCCCDEPNCG